MARVLIVEDAENARKAIRMWLETIFPDQEVLEAATGEDAVKIAAFESPDLILMDITLPEMSGIVATRCIRLGGSPAQIVMLTMHEGRVYREAAMAAGANAFVPKCKIGTELAPLLQEWLPTDTLPENNSISNAL